MDSPADDRKRKSAYARRKGRIVEGEGGRQIWQGTIKQVKLSLMKTGTYIMSKAHGRLMNLGDTLSNNVSDEPDEDMELTGENGGYDPRESTDK